jgi:hypothetical protein
VIANVNQGRHSFQLGPQSPRKEDELIDVSQPFRDEAARISKASQERLRLDQFCRDARRDQAIQHHLGKALHALLAIGRVVTDQQNHCFDGVVQQDRAYDRHRPSGAPRFARSLARRSRGRPLKSRFRRPRFAPLRRDR